MAQIGVQRHGNFARENKTWIYLRHFSSAAIDTASRCYREMQNDAKSTKWHTQAEIMWQNESANYDRWWIEIESNLSWMVHNCSNLSSRLLCAIGQNVQVYGAQEYTSANWGWIVFQIVFTSQIIRHCIIVSNGTQLKLHFRSNPVKLAAFAVSFNSNKFCIRRGNMRMQHANNR